MHSTLHSCRKLPHIGVFVLFEIRAQLETFSMLWDETCSVFLCLRGLDLEVLWILV